MALSINEGTQTTVFSDQIGAIEVPIVKLDVGAAGLTSPFTGTVKAITNLAGGSVVITAVPALYAEQTTPTALQSQTLGIGLRHGDEFATVVSGTGTTTGTVKAAVSGSTIYVTGLVISAGTAADTRVGLSSGTGTLNNVLGTLCFGSNGGLALTPIDPPLRTTSGSALVWSQAGTSNVTITCVGYID